MLPVASIGGRHPQPGVRMKQHQWPFCTQRISTHATARRVGNCRAFSSAQREAQQLQPSSGNSDPYYAVAQQLSAAHNQQPTYAAIASPQNSPTAEDAAHAAESAVAALLTTDPPANSNQQPATSAVAHAFPQQDSSTGAISEAASSTISTSAAPSAVAMDVEYTHLLLQNGKWVAAPAWVAVVDEDCNLLLKTYIRPEVPGIQRSHGGVPYSLCATAPPLADVRQQLKSLLTNKTLVGHGLAKDLAALGLSHPQNRRYDTITYPGFCNRAGNAKTLQDLSKQFLNLDIQQQPRQGQTRGSGSQRRGRGGSARRRQRGGQHDPEEDAAAVMKLYQQVVVPSTYEGQVAAATRQVLQEIQRRRQQLALQQEQEISDD